MYRGYIRRHRSFIKLFLNMTLVIIIPFLIIVSGFIYAVNRTVTQDYMSMNSQIISSITNSVDASIISQVNFAYSVRNVSSVKNLSANIVDDSTEYQSTCDELRDLLEAVLFNNIASAVALYFPSLDAVVSTYGSVASAEDFYERYLNYDNMTAEEFYDYMVTVDRSMYYPSRLVSPSCYYSRNVLIYIQPIAQGYLMPRAYYISIIDEAEFRNLVSTNFGYDVCFQVFDKYENELLHTLDVSDEWAGLPQDAASVFKDGVSYHIFRTDTFPCGLSFVFYLPESAVMQQLGVFKYIFAASAMVCLLMGFFIANKITRKLYEPYDQLLKTAIPGVQSNDISNIHEGFQKIADKVFETQQLNEQIRRELGEYFRTRQDTALLNLITRSKYMSGDELNEMADICKLPLNNSEYRIAIVSNAAAEQIFSMNAQPCTDEHNSLYTARLSEKQYVVVMASSEYGARQADMIAGIQLNKCDMGISRVHADIRDLYMCLNEADDDYHRNMARALDESDTQFSYYPIEYELRLMAAARDGLYDEVSRLIADIRNIVAEATHDSEQMLLELCGNITDTANKIYQQLSDDARGVLSSEMEHINGISGETFDSEHWMNELLMLYRRICNVESSDVHIKNQRIIEGVVEYINANFADSELCLDSVAEHLDVSYYFLSRIFKMETNQSFSDMLNGVRTRHAMALLNNPKLSVQEVSAQVGYTNFSTFLRAFKKYVGTTPHQYRLKHGDDVSKK